MSRPVSESAPLPDGKPRSSDAQLAPDALSPDSDFPALLSCVLTAMKEGVSVLDEHGCILYTNAAEDRMFGYEPGELIGRHLTAQNAYPPAENARLAAEVAARLRSHGSWEGEWLNKKKDGTPFHTQTRITPAEVHGKTYWVCLHADVTEQRLRELAEINLTAVVESSDDAIITKDLNGIITGWNPGAQAIFGYTAEEIIGLPVSTLAAPERRDEFPAILEKLRRGERIEHFETERRTKEGRRIFVSLTVSPIRNSRGEVIGASKIARDITQNKRIERELMLLVEASSALIASPHSEQVLHNIVHLARQFVTADGHGVWRQSGETWQLVSSSGLSDEYISQAHLQTNEAVAFLTGPVMCDDIATSPILKLRKEQLAREGIRSMLIVPLRIHGSTCGTVVFYWKNPYRATAAQMRVATALGNLAAAALGTAELYDQETRSRKRAEWSETRSRFLAAAGSILSSSLDFEATLANVARLAVPDFADWCSVDILNEKQQARRVVIHHHDPAMVELARQYALKFPPREQDATSIALRTGKSMLVEEVTDEMISSTDRGPEHIAMLRKLGLKSVMIVPMVLGEESLGIITFVTSEPDRRYSRHDLALQKNWAAARRSRSRTLVSITTSKRTKRVCVSRSRRPG